MPACACACRQKNTTCLALTPRAGARAARPVHAALQQRGRRSRLSTRPQFFSNSGNCRRGGDLFLFRFYPSHRVTVRELQNSLSVREVSVFIYFHLHSGSYMCHARAAAGCVCVWVPMFGFWILDFHDSLFIYFSNRGIERPTHTPPCGRMRVGHIHDFVDSTYGFTRERLSQSLSAGLQLREGTGM